MVGALTELGGGDTNRWHPPSCCYCRWKFILYVRSFRKRYAAKRVINFLEQARRVLTQKKAQRVVRKLFRNLKTAQRFTRSFLDCNRARYVVACVAWGFSRGGLTILRNMSLTSGASVMLQG